jgi:hypothetical protein
MHAGGRYVGRPRESRGLTADVETSWPARSAAAHRYQLLPQDDHPQGVVLSSTVQIHLRHLLWRRALIAPFVLQLQVIEDGLQRLGLL